MDGQKQTLGCFAAGILAGGISLSACAPPDASPDPAQWVRVSMTGAQAPPTVFGLALPTVAPEAAPDSIERSRARYDEAGLALVDAQHVWHSLRQRSDIRPEALQQAQENLRRARSALAEAAREYDETRRRSSSAKPLTQQSPRLILAQESGRR